MSTESDAIAELVATTKAVIAESRKAALLEAAEDAVFSGIPGMAIAESPADREKVVQRWLRDRAERIES